MVTVEPVKEVVGAGESVQFRFRRTGSIAEALTISFQGFEHPSSGDATLADASVTFLADNDTVVYTNDVTSSGTVNPSARAHTVLIYGDAGRGGLHRSWIAGDPNRATVVVGDNNSNSYMAMTASYPGRVAAGESVGVEYTVTNLGTTTLPGNPNGGSDGTRISTTPDRGSCYIRDDIPEGQSRTCSASSTVTNQDVTNGKIEFNATARNGSSSSTLHVYIRVAQPVEFGFAATTTLEVTEGPDVTATLPVTRTGRLNEAVTVAYRLRPHENKPAILDEDFTDPSSTPGLLTFPANATSANIVINITQDQIDEERERFRVDLVPFTDGTITEGKKSRVVRIIDEQHQGNDPYRPTASLQLVSADPTPESADSVDFAVVLNRVWGREGRYEVELDAHDNLTATPAFSRLGRTGDFEAPDGLIHATIPAGQTRFEFSLTLYDDDVREEDETFQLLLTSPYDASFRTIGMSDTALATIADDDRIPPAEVVMSLSHNGSALESVPEGSTQQDITVTASFPQIRWPGDASNAPLRPADPRDVDTTVRVTFDDSDSAAAQTDLERFQVADSQGTFQDVESFDIVIPAGQTSGTTTLRFKPANDDVDEEDETVILQGAEVVASDSDEFLPVRSASFTIIDDDTRGITASSSSALSGLSLVEGGEPETYSLVLDSQPTDTVVITLAGNQGGFLRIVPDTLTFTTSDWATPQTVSLMALDDGIVGGVSPQDLVTHQVSGGDYGSVMVDDILVSIEDTTNAFVYLEGGQASESDGHVEFTVTVRPVLRTTPVLVRYATVDGTAIAGSDYTREVETGQTYKILNIPAGRSSGAIRIPITDDQVYESADETFTLQLTNHNDKATLDGDATSLTATSTIADDDPKPVVSVAGPAGAVSYVSESVKDPVTFTLTLVGQSAGDVTVDYATGEAGLLGLLTARQGLAGATEDEDYAGTSGTVTFTSGQTTKTVTVPVTNDEVSEDTEFFGFTIRTPRGADLRGRRSEDVADVGLLDDDTRGVTVDPTSIGLDEPASGETAVAGAYTVNLNSKPTGTVTVTVGGSDPAVSLSGDTLTNNQLTFTTTNWNTAQTITVTPVKDDNAVGETITLTHTLSGGDYAGIAADSVTVNLTDSDNRNIVLSRQSLTVTEGDAAGVQYTVKLATQPSDTITVTISGHDGADLTLSGTTLTNNQLTFTTANWGTAQTVTAEADDDNNVDNESATLAHTASGGDYVNVTKDLPVSITDDDTAGVTISETELTIEEGGSDTYTVVLDTEAVDTVIVTISGHSGTDVSLSTTTLTFTSESWDTEQTVTVTAERDVDAIDESETTLVHTTGSSDIDYSGATVASVTVSITDDDTAGVTISETELTIEEGATSTYTVVLDTEPTATTTVTVNDPSNTDVTAAPESLTFTTESWDTEQTVTITAGQDEDSTEDTATVTHTVASADSDYQGAAASDVIVTVTDADDPAVSVSFGQATYSATEGGGVEVSVILSVAPERRVVILITRTEQGGATSTDYSGVPDSVTFENGETEKSFAFGATQDDVDDDGESVKLTFGELPDRVTEGATTAATVSIEDDDDPRVSVSFESDSYSVAEGSTTTVTVMLSADPEREVAIDLVKTNVGGATDSDYSGVPDSVTFSRRETEFSFVFTAARDLIGDGGESVELTFGDQLPPGVDPGVTSTSSVSIIDVSSQGGTPPLLVSFGHSVYPVPEGATGQVSVRLSAAPGSDVTIPITKTEKGGATTTDYSGVPDVVTFGATDTEKSFVFTATQDSDDDDGESVELGFGDLPGGLQPGMIATTSVAIADDDGPESVEVRFESDTYTVDEGSATSIQVILSEDPERDVVIPITRAGQGGATSTDYSVPTSVMFNAGETSKTIVFTAEQDGIDDSGESVRLTFGELPDRVSAGSVSTTTVSITDDDTAGVTISETELTIEEGATSTYTVVLDTEPTATTTVTVNDPSNTDVTAAPESLTFTTESWDTEQTVTITAGQDEDSTEDTATVTHTVASADSDYQGAAASDVIVTVTDADDPAVSVSFGQATYSATEGGGVEVSVILSVAPGRRVVILITRTEQGGATSTDYSGVPDSVTFENGETEKSFAFGATQDDVDDDGESVKLTFGELPDRVTEGATTAATVSIEDDDDPRVSVSFESDSYSVAEGSTTTVTVMLSADPERGVAIDLVKTNVGGATDSDYSGVPDSVTFSRRETEFSFVFTAARDLIGDGGESVELTFGDQLPPGVDPGATSTATVRIIDVSSQGGTPSLLVSFGHSVYPVPEGATVTVTVTLSAAPGSDVTIPITKTEMGGATTTDYSGVPDVVPFGATDTEKSFVFVATQDSDDDDGESVELGFGDLPGGVQPGAIATTSVAISDDDGPESVEVRFESDTYTVMEGSTVTVTVALSEDPDREVVIPITKEDRGGATSTDYSGVPGSVTFVSGQTLKSFTFEAIQDDADDDGESVVLAFGTSLPSRVTEGAPKAARVSINQMSRQLVPEVTVSFGQAAYTVAEGGMVTVAVDLSADPDRTITVLITATSQDGASSADYSGVPESLTFNSGQTSKSFEFMATADSSPPTPVDGTAPTNLRTYEGDQSLQVAWSWPEVRDPSAPVTSYRMRYRQLGASRWQNEPLDDDSGWHTISGLTNRRHYEVQVAAVTRLGTGAWASTKGTPQALSPSAAPGPVGDEAFNVDRPNAYWEDPYVGGRNILREQHCTGTKGFTVIWADPNAVSGPDVHRGADEWAAHIDTTRGAGTVTYGFRPSPSQRNYYEMNGTVNFEGPGSLSLRVRGRFDSTWGTWSPTASLYCFGETDENVKIRFGTLPSGVIEGTPNVATVTIKEVSAGSSRSVSGTEAKGEPRIDGVPEVGQTLSTDTTAIADADGLENGIFRYQWLSEDTDIAGAIGSTYTLASGDVGKAIRVRVTFTDGWGNEETLTSAPTMVTAGLQLQSATADGATLTLTYDEVLDTGVTLGTTPFAVSVNGSSRSLIGVGVGESNVLLLLSPAVEAGDTVTVDYAAPDGPDFIRDTRGRKASSFTGQAVTNDSASAMDDMASAPLTASAHDVPSSHDGQDAFTFELRFSEDPKSDLSYTTVRDHAFTVTGGSVTHVRQLDPPSNIGWEITVTPETSAAVAIALNATTDCSAQGAICTENGGKLSGGLLLVVPGPNTPATGAPTITGAARVGETLTAVASGIEDADGLDNVTFNYQWLADTDGIAGATVDSYTLADADEGKAIKVRVSFTDDAGNDEQLTSAATGAVAAVPPPPNTPATGRSHHHRHGQGGRDPHRRRHRHIRRRRPRQRCLRLPVARRRR